MEDKAGATRRCAGVGVRRDTHLIRAETRVFMRWRVLRSSVRRRHFPSRPGRFTVRAVWRANAPGDQKDSWSTGGTPAVGKDSGQGEADSSVRDQE